MIKKWGEEKPDSIGENSSDTSTINTSVQSFVCHIAQLPSPKPKKKLITLILYSLFFVV